MVEVMPKAGDRVLYSVAGKPSNALVLSSNRGLNRSNNVDDVHVNLVYVDEDLEVAVKVMAASPVAEGRSTGWSLADPPVPAPTGENSPIMVPFDQMLDLCKRIQFYGRDLEISPDAIVPSACKLIDRMAPSHAVGVGTGGVPIENPTQAASTSGSTDASSSWTPGMAAAPDPQSENSAPDPTGSATQFTDTLGMPESPSAYTSKVSSTPERVVEFDEEGNTQDGGPAPEVHSSIADTAGEAEPEIGHSAPFGGDIPVANQQLATPIEPDLAHHETLGEKIKEDFEKAEESVGEAIGEAIENRD